MDSRVREGIRKRIILSREQPNGAISSEGSASCLPRRNEDKIVINWQDAQSSPLLCLTELEVFLKTETLQ